jgi:hypothetical protein
MRVKNRIVSGAMWNRGRSRSSRRRSSRLLAITAIDTERRIAIVPITASTERP